MVEKVKIDLEHCYGIKTLKHELDFSNNNMPVVIYSPNGTMKTSFAMALQDYSDGKPSLDRVRKDLQSKTAITDQNDEPPRVCWRLFSLSYAAFGILSRAA